jgi:hypothetical protein
VADHEQARELHFVIRKPVHEGGSPIPGLADDDVLLGGGGDDRLDGGGVTDGCHGGVGLDVLLRC